MIHSEPAEVYHARKAVSAGFLWDMVKPDGCPRQAWFDSVFNPNPPPRKVARELDIGNAAHLAVLEPDELAGRIWLIDADSYRTKAAQEERDAAYIAKRTPLLADQYQLVCGMRQAIEASPAAELLFGEGQSEVSYTWETAFSVRRRISAGRDATFVSATSKRGRLRFEEVWPCKARADRITPHAIVDLKTAASASPEAFQRALMRDGHHLRAAWYLDGLIHAREQAYPILDYLYVVVAKVPPHLVEVYQLEEHAVQMGRRLYCTALSQFRECQATGIWPGYRRKDKRIGLPTREEYRLADMEADGDLEI